MVEDTACLLDPGRFTRLVARGRHAALDRAIADGADLAGSPLLAARSAQLATMQMRSRVADDLERVALSAEDRASRFHALPAAQAVRRNRDELMALAHTLRAGGAAYVRGIALLELVVTDGAGAAYTDRDGARLARRLRQARRRLAG